MLPAAQPPTQMPQHVLIQIGVITRLFFRMIRDRAYGDIVVRVKDGALVGLQVNQSYLPAKLPDV